MRLLRRRESVAPPTPPAEVQETRVLYPRFETEDNPDARIECRELVRRAQRRLWLPEVEMAILLKPQAIVETISRVKLVRERPWLGVYHIAAGRLTLARLFHSPFNDQTQLYRSRYLEHSFLRDEQALDGRSIEIILERFKVHEPTSEEVTAVLVEQPGWTNYGGQTIVMKDETGEWVEPPVNQDCPERDFNLAVLMQLAERVKPVSVAQSQR